VSKGTVLKMREFQLGNAERATNPFAKRKNETGLKQFTLRSSLCLYLARIHCACGCWGLLKMVESLVAGSHQSPSDNATN
jgi:hypothetical protein